jgi:hypothetical protein
VNANWPYPFYASGYVLLAALILRGNWPERQRFFLRKIFFLGTVLGMLVALAVYQLPRRPSHFPSAAQRLLYKFCGWKDLAQNVSHHMKEEIVITSRRDYAAELAFYLPGKPQTYVFWQGSIRSQYDLWDGLSEKICSDAILVLKKTKEARKISSCFDELEYLGRWEREIFGKKRKVHLYRGHHLNPCPYLGPTS